MKRFIVEITDQAFEAIRDQAHYIAYDQKSPLNAKHWLEGLWDAIDSLELLPKRCPLAIENSLYPSEIHQLLYGHFRILFTVDKERRIVQVIGFRHGRQQLQQEDINYPMD